MTQLITCLGEILIDFLPMEEAGTTVGFRMHPGGSPLNVAVGLARLGKRTAYASKASSDFFGRYLRAVLEREGIDTRFLLECDAFTTLAFVAVKNDGQPSFSFYNQGTADTLLQPDELPPALVHESGALHVGSISLLAGTTPAAVLATVERLAGRALVSFDPNIRPGLVGDEGAYRALLDQLFRLADIVKLSADDVAWLLPHSTPEAAAATLLGYGPTLVVITKGDAGAVAMRADPAQAEPEWFSVEAFEVPVADTVGAGDTFSAALLAFLDERGALSQQALRALPASDLSDALRFASAAAALTCSRAGANPPRRDELASFLKQRAPASEATHS